MANFVTIFRMFLIFFVSFLLFRHTPHSYLLAILLVIVVFSMDGVDGYIARKYNEVSKFGAMLDIMSDRVIENVLWVAFAVLGWLPIVFPIISLLRSFVVDGIRSVAMEQGYTAFGETSMQEDKVGYFICASKFSRISYAAAKAIAFVLMIFAKTPGLDKDIAVFLYAIAYMAAIVAIMFCILRGLPVVFESKKLFKNGSRGEA